MSLKTLQEGAILIADAHCAPWRTSFIDFLHALESDKIVTPQLILMGDIFDMLYGPIQRSYRYSTEGIDLLNRLGKKIEIIYLEGNHDFLLTDLFPGITVIRREEQPIVMDYEGKKVALSHGDSSMGWGYELYTALIRNPLLLAFLRMLDTLGGGFIVSWLEEQMKRKSHCRNIDDFERLTEQRLSGFKSGSADVLIEGHFHQNRSIKFPQFDYINVGAFACNERYFTVQSNQNKTLLRECSFS
ncbi:metallophosphoesterase [Sulfuricurvum kujiense DSM 16994]|uniref:Metallophosphoesterase n=1 Tax=Sulfuricurvum kujiense (strain ATCC BAA-921 / DSM 16994 / JCM 11577 / YK-1) TaxID=709032 RepID=E4U0D3_SULKY|nr:UDP-2,3-diacylglucosamine diphosphatase [Sulfuricurvum kujiense]ADR33230.1 metallophosphoesterase [Sulfuricurvum kujiense DSM 16994]